MSLEGGAQLMCDSFKALSRSSSERQAAVGEVPLGENDKRIMSSTSRIDL